MKIDAKLEIKPKSSTATKKKTKNKPKNNLYWHETISLAKWWCQSTLIAIVKQETLQ